MYNTLGGLNVKDNMSKQGLSNAGIKSGGSMSGYSGYASTISTVANVAQGFAETSAFKANLRSRRDNDFRNSQSILKNFELEKQNSMENVNAINEALGDKLSERGLTAMKEASLLRAAAAETGTSGGTTDTAIQEAYMNEAMDRANMRAGARNQISGVYAQLANSHNAKRDMIDSMLIGGGVKVNTNPLVAGIANGLNVGMTAIDMLPMKERAELIGVLENE